MRNRCSEIPEKGYNKIMREEGKAIVMKEKGKAVWKRRFCYETV